MATTVLTRDDPRHAIAEAQAERLERLGQAHRLFFRVTGGAISARAVRFTLSLPLDLVARLTAMLPDVAVAFQVPTARVVQDNDHLAVEIPQAPAAILWLVRLQAQMPPLPRYTALLGRDQDTAPLLLRFTPSTSHVLVAGSAGAGKTNLVRAILLSLTLGGDPPDDPRLVLVDLTGQNLHPFAGLPQVVGDVLYDRAAAERRLAWLVDELGWRVEQGVRFPRIIVAIDEVTDLLETNPGTRDHLLHLAQHGGESGLHLLLSTGRPAAPALQELLPLLPIRLVGRVSSAAEAVAATSLKGTGAERLCGRGDFLLATAGECVPFQAGYVTPAEIATYRTLLEEEQTAARSRPGPVVPALAPIQPRLAGLVSQVRAWLTG